MVVEFSELSEKKDMTDLSDFLEVVSLGKLSSIAIECVIIMHINVLLIHVSDIPSIMLRGYVVR